jgi:hypothetical protein
MAYTSSDRRNVNEVWQIFEVAAKGIVFVHEKLSALKLLTSVREKGVIWRYVHGYVESTAKVIPTMGSFEDG